MFYKKRLSTKPVKKDAMAHPSVNISKGTYKVLDELRVKTGIPIPRLIAFAIDNELDSKSPFTYSIPEVNEEYVQGKYYPDAYKIYKYLAENFKNGIGYDLLLICRLDFGIPDKLNVMLGCRELLERGMIEERTSYRPWNGQNYKIIKLCKEARLEEDKKLKHKPIERIGALQDVDIDEEAD